MNVNNILSTALLTSTIALLLMAPNAHAVTLERSVVQNATGACQAALPSFEGNIRKRLLVVSNDGTTTAVVTCSFASTDRGVGGQRSIDVVIMNLDNNTASPVNVTCTLADGYSNSSLAYLAKTLTLSANSKNNEYFWGASDNGGLNFFFTVNATCALPPGTAIGITFVYYDEDVGA